PFMATEEILMKATRASGDRQQLHEAIRQHSLAAMEEVKRGGRNDLLERLQNDALFRNIDLEKLAEPARYVGRAPEQVSEFLNEIVEPLLARYPETVVHADIQV
ncbi:MAG TPA: hypothetical protein PKD72_15935, partial [Gemmatales bacterium]|nr:hypothetical protein [Gemmatales bacterium]